MKKIFSSLLAIGLLFSSCGNNDDDNNSSTLSPSEINLFIYNGLNAVYLYQDEVPDLANDRFSNVSERNNFISRAGSPESFFETLTTVEDRFSWIVDDFEELERSFEGTSLSSGMKFYIVPFSNGGNERLIVVYDVVKNSPADNVGIKRGMFFTLINGQQINVNNQNKLFTDTSFSLTEGIIDSNNSFVITDNVVTINKIELTENPIAISKVIPVENSRIAYIQYNGFVSNFDEELNDVFGNFKNENVTDLVLDFRYNGGGSVASADALMGMITGDLENEIFAKIRYNSNITAQVSAENSLLRFSNKTFNENTPLNSLNLNKIYVITSKEQTASASELVINSLKPYIDVVVIGDERGTVGKSQGSNTIYDSPSLFSKENVNPNHTYAMQPLISELINSNNVRVDPITGILPNILIQEDFTNLGVLGSPEERLLKVAIDEITGRNILSLKKVSSNPFGKIIGNESMYKKNYQRMYHNILQ